MTVRTSGLVLSAVTAGVLGLGLASPAYAVNSDRDCPDFDSQADAQAAYDADTSDPERLDRDNDGIACESHNYGSGSDDADGPSNNDDSDSSGDDDQGQLPVGGVAAGGGGTARLPYTSSGDSLPLVPGLVALGGAVVLATGARLAYRAR